MDGGGQKEAAVQDRFGVALAFLTRIPWPARMMPLGAAMDTFPAVGALIGGSCGAIYWVAASLGGSTLLAAVLAMAFGIAVTGALHEDGLADAADGLGGQDRERRLAIMRDSRIGTYGVLALIVALAAKAAALAELRPIMAVALLAATGAFSRMAIVWLMWSTPPARADGLAAAAGQPTRDVAMRAIAAGAGGAALLIVLGSGVVAAVAAMAAGAAAAWLVRWRALRLLGGQTGDVCGALQVLCEIAMLLALALTNR